MVEALALAVTALVLVHGCVPLAEAQAPPIKIGLLLPYTGVIGPVNSAVALAIRGYVHDQGIALIVPVAATRVLTAPPLASPWIFRTTDNTDQGNFPLGAWLMKNTKHRKAIVMATDFVAGRDSAGAFIAGFRAAGGEVVKEIYAPFRAGEGGARSGPLRSVEPVSHRSLRDAGGEAGEPARERGRRQDPRGHPGGDVDLVEEVTAPAA